MPDPVARTAAFLRRHPPFRDLEPEERQVIAEEARGKALVPGAPVFVEGGPPERHLSIIVEGAVELVVAGRVVDVLQAGEIVDVGSVLSDLPPTLTARAREETALLLIPRRTAVDVLSRPAGAAFVASMLDERLSRVVRAIGPSADPHNVPVASLIRRAPVVCRPDTTVREAASMMSAADVSAVLVDTRDGLGIVSNADLRDKVIAGNLAADAPVSLAMSVPVITIRGDRLAGEASIEMLSHGVNHLVVVDEGERPVGVISAAGLMAAEELNPVGLRRSIQVAGSEEEVIAVAARMPRSFLSLMDAGIDAPTVSRILTLQLDALTERLLGLAMGRHGRAPVGFAWLALGSAGRHELTLGSDQDNAIAYEDTDDPKVKAYFGRLAADVNEGLQRCGFPLDTSGVVAGDSRWCLTRSGWVRLLRDTFEVWDADFTVLASVVFDFRRVTGDLEIVAPLTEVVLEARDHPSLRQRVARTATDIPSPLGFRQRLTGPVDIKKSALLPIQNMARYFALSNGVTVAPTLDRLAAVGQLRGVGAQVVEQLPEAFKAVWQLRLRHHAKAIRDGRRLDDAVDSTKLRPLTYAELQQALRLVAAAQKRVPRVLNPGDLAAHL